MSIAPAIRDTAGLRQCIPPLVLGRLLDKAKARKNKTPADKWAKFSDSSWKHIDALNAAMEAARK